MTTEQTLLRAICAEPWGDTVRLGYADWLDERDTEKTRWHAAMIRGQTDPYGPQRWVTTFPDVADWVYHNHRFSVWIDGVCHFRPDSQSSQGDNEPAFYIARGFVSVIRCTLAEFFGEPCGHCLGEGMLRDEVPCSRCRGRAREQGLAEKLFIQHPITQVVLTDREPLEFDSRWLWHNADHRLTSSEYDGDTRPAVIFADHLPAVIFDRLTGFAKRNSRVAEMVKNYPTRESTMQALSLAAVNYARSLHDLPPLEKDQVPA
jgi:uncharacterized protein (TIGR02996 family)